MPPKKSSTKPPSRKAQAKRANAPMKHKPAAKPPKAMAKAEASRAARTMAKAVKPGMRKSAAKRTEKTVMSAAALKRIEDIRALGDSLIHCIRQDVRASANGAVNSTRAKKMLVDMMDIMVEAGEEMYGGAK